MFMVRMLTENPDIKGIALPGMPAGFPGISGTKDAFEILFITGTNDPAQVYTKQVYTKELTQMMSDGMGGMAWGMGLVGLLVLIVLVLAIAALIKYLLAR